MEVSSHISAVLGGLLIGLSAVLMLVLQGRVAGVSGILGGVIAGARERWRVMFLFGLLVGGVMLAKLSPGVVAAPDGRSITAIALAGLLVGVGTQIGNGCTSGHGVCGIGRFSKRSLVATMVFMGFGMITASVIYLTGVGA